MNTVKPGVLKAECSLFLQWHRPRGLLTQKRPNQPRLCLIGRAQLGCDLGRRFGRLIEFDQDVPITVMPGADVCLAWLSAPASRMQLLDDGASQDLSAGERQPSESI